MGKFLKKGILMILLLCFVAVLFTACGSSQDIGVNLLKNGSFEEIKDGRPTDWSIESWYEQPDGTIRAELADDAKDGQAVGIVENTRNNDARMTQNVSVRPNSYYVLSAWIKTEGVEDSSTIPADSDQIDRVGANISVLNVYYHSEDLMGDNGWTQVFFYGKTGAKQKEMIVAVRLGFYSGENEGKAYFDDVSLERIEKLPDGVSEISFAPATAQTDDSGEPTDAQKISSAILKIILVAMAAVAAGWFLTRYVFKNPKANLFTDRTGILLVLIIGLVIRIVLAVSYLGFDVDIGCFAAWGSKMLSDGPFKFYSTGYFCDYPPLYMFVLGIVSGITQLFGLEADKGMGLLLLKLPAITADVLSALVIYFIARKKLGNKVGTLLAALYFLNPAILVNSSSWGQIDSILALLIILCIYFMQQKRYSVSVLIYLAAILTKPQAIVFGPVMIFGLADEIHRIITSKDVVERSRRSWYLAGAFAGSFIVFAFISYFMKNDQGSILWLIEKYKTTVSSYQYAALNVFNLHAFLGGQWAPLDNAVFLGISYKALGWIGITLVTLASFGYFIFAYLKKLDVRKYFWLLAAFLAIGSVMLGNSAHERYLYPALAMLLFSYIYTEDKRLLALFGGFSFIHYINVSVVLHQYMINNTYMDGKSILIILGSFFSLALFVYLISIMNDLFIKNQPKQENKTDIAIEELIPPQHSGAKPSQSRINKMQTAMFLESGRKKKEKNRFTWKDYTIMLAITGIYAVVAYTNLGTTSAPENYWYPENVQQYVIADLGQTQQVDEIYLNAARSGGSVTLSYSDDKTQWTKVEKLYLTGDMVNRWTKLGEDSEKMPLNARYIRLSVDSGEIGINELVFRRDGVNIEVKDVEGSDNPLLSAEYGVQAIFDNPESLTTYLAAGGNYYPENAWVANAEGDGFIMDMGQETTLGQVYCNMKTASDYSAFTLYYSADKINWTEWTSFAPSENDCGAWRQLREDDAQTIQARYVELVADFASFSINELVFSGGFDAEGQVPASFESLSTEGQPTDEYGGIVMPDTNYQACFDEQATFAAWLSSGVDFEAGSWWDAKEESDYVIADFGSEQKIQRLYYFNGIGEGTFTIKYSVDKENWSDLDTVSYSSGMMYKWQRIPENDNGYANVTARYVMITADVPYFRMLECGFYSSADATEPIPIAKVEGPAGDDSYANVYDEQDTIPLRSSYLNSMYFDEIYHGRTAYESLHSEDYAIYEITHPPLGKDIMSWSVAVFGMNPFGWRFAGTLMGVLMLPALYVFGKKLFGKTVFATALTLLMALDGMHFVQTRIATIDSYGVFFIILMFLFMYKYYTMNFFEDGLWKTLVPLGLCGVMFGLGAASKWIGIYAGAGLAVLLFMVLYERYGEYLHAKRELERNREAHSPQDIAYMERIRSVFVKNTIITLLWCVVFFVIIPVAIYCISYYPYFTAKGNEGVAWYKVVWNNQKYMFAYHSGLKDDHFFSSPWYQWPIIFKPMWFYKGDELAQGHMECISSFGNPLVWYAGLASTLASAALLVLKIRKRYAARTTQELLSRKKEISLLVFVFIGLATNFMPWVLVSRSMFIYHYFASLPFIMIFTVYIWQQLCKHYGKKVYYYMAGFFVLALILFIMFYPLWSGMEVTQKYVNDYLKWLPTWYFGS